MHNPIHAHPKPRAQQGAALVVGLLLLLVLTLLAISGMNTASLELVMAGNAQYYQNAFQAAETGIERALVDGDFNPGSSQRIPAEDATEIPGTSDTFVASIAPQMGGKALPAMWGSTWYSFSTFHFEIQSVGTSSRNAVATNRQGIAVIAPFDPTVLPLDPTSPALTDSPAPEPTPPAAPAP
jgi:type IV pilus assembly protein PilX